MDKFATLLAMVAIAGVAWFAINKDADGNAGDQTEQVELLRTELADLRSRFDNLEGTRAPAILDGNLPKTVPGYEGHSAAGEPGARPFSERLARLESMMTTQRDEIAEVKEEAAKPGRGMPFMPSGKRFLRNSDDAAKALKLSDAQKSDMERVLDNARDEFTRLHDTQDDNGRTINDLNKEMSGLIKPGEEMDHTKILSHVGKLGKFKRGKVPGTNETFAQAERRIHKSAMSEIRRGMDPEQQKEWDQSNTAGLLPGGGTTTSFVMAADSHTMIFGDEDK